MWNLILATKCNGSFTGGRKDLKYLAQTYTYWTPYALWIDLAKVNEMVELAYITMVLRPKKASSFEKREETFEQYVRRMKGLYKDPTL